MRRLVFAALLCAAGSLAGLAPGLHAQAGGGDCVTINKPNPATTFVFRHEDSSGAITEFTQQWEDVSETGSRVRTTRRGVVTFQSTRHTIKDDIGLISRMTQANTSNVTDNTDFKPGMVGDPVFRACADRSWAIPAVTAYYQGGGRSASAATQSGSLRIVATRETVKVPAGEFQTVHYTRTMKLPKGQNFNEYWKSIEHGVVVKHIATLPNGRATEQLIAIKR
jgi:hypothetical protein